MESKTANKIEEKREFCEFQDKFLPISKSAYNSQNAQFGLVM